MKANELRIGSYYNYDGDLIKLDGSTLASYLQNDTDFNLEPILLTEEWLLNFGYDLITDRHYAILGHIVWKCNDLFMCDKNGIIIKYVHQLQNLYFTLTNEELTYD